MLVRTFGSSVPEHNCLTQGSNGKQVALTWINQGEFNQGIFFFKCGKIRTTLKPCLSLSPTLATLLTEEKSWGQGDKDHASNIHAFNFPVHFLGSFPGS